MANHRRRRSAKRYPKRRNVQQRRNNLRRSQKRRPVRKKSIFEKIHLFTKKYPLWTGIILVLGGIILFRFSFTNTFLRSQEVFVWAILVSIGLFIAGIFVIKAYWKNNVSNLTTRHNVNWRRR